MYKLLKIISIIVSCYCIYKMHVFDYPFWQIPFVYMLLIHWYSASKPCTGAGHTALMIAMSGRYLLTPLSIYGTESLSKFATQYGYLNEAIILIIYEMISLFIVLFICDKKYKLRVRGNTCNSQQSFAIIGRMIKPYWFYITLSVWLIIAVFYKNIVGGFNVLVSGALNEMREVEQVNYGASNIIGGILWQTLCVWIFSYLVFRQRGLVASNNLQRPVILSLIYTIVIITLSFIDQSGLSRWFTIVITGASVAMLLKLFPHEKKLIVLTIIVPSAILILFITLFKNVGLILGESSIGDALFDLFDPSKMDIYFSGPVNVNNALNVYYNSNLDISTIINDLCNNMPIVNHYMDTRETSVYAYNASLGRIYDNNAGDQIMPLIGQSMIYFGLLLAPLLSCFSTIIVCWADYKFTICKDFLLFLFSFIAIWFAVESMMLNLTITASWMYNRIIPFYLAFWLTNKMSGIKKVSNVREI